jgi:CHASE3 domain sensor protein
LPIAPSRIPAPATGWHRRLPWWLGAATLGAFLLLLGLLAAAGLRLARDAETADRWVDHTLEILAETGHLLGAMQDAETGVGGYLLTLDPGHLGRHESGRAAVRDHLARARRLVLDNAAQQERLAALEAAAAARLAVLDRVVDLARHGEPAAALATVRGGEGRRHMQEVRRLAQEMRAEADHLLRQRRQEAAAAGRRMAGDLLLATTAALLAALGGVAGLLALGRRRRRAEQAAAQAESEARLRHALGELGAVYGTVPVGLCLVDRGFRFRSINAALAAMNGLPAEAHLSRTVAEVLPDLWPLLEPLYRAVLERAARPSSTGPSRAPPRPRGRSGTGSPPTSRCATSGPGRSGASARRCAT